MQTDENREFDLLVRSMMEKAQEEAPSRVWDAVSAELDASASRPSSLRWRRLATGFAAAAAIAALGVFLFRNDSTLQDTGDGIVATVQRTAVQDGDGALADVTAMDGVPSSTGTAHAAEAVTAGSPSSSQQSAAPSMRDLLAEAYAVSDAVPKMDEAPAVQSPSEDGAASDTGRDGLKSTDGEAPTSDESGNDLTASGQGVDAATLPSRDTEAATSQERDIEVAEEATAESSPDDGVDPFARLDDGECQAGSGISGVSLSIDGNVQSNSLSGSSLKVPFRAPGIGSVPTETTLTEIGESTYGIPVSFGLGVRIGFTPRWSVGTGMNVTWLSRSFRGQYYQVEATEDAPAGTSVSDEIDHDMLYAGVPINVYFDVLKSSSVRFYAWSGGTVEKALYNKYRIPYNGSKLTYGKDVTGVQISAAAGMGVELKLIGGLGLYIDPSLRYYFDCEQPRSIRTEEPLMMTLDIGLRLDL